MLVRPLPGVTGENILTVVREALTTIDDARTQRQGYMLSPVTDYISWANSAASRFRTVMSVGDVERLIFTPAHDRVLSHTGTAGLGAHLVDYAIDTTKTELEAVASLLEEQTRHWSFNNAVFVVLDTGFYIKVPCPPESEGKFDLRKDVDFAGLLDADDKVHVIVPIAVVDELDGLKQRGDKHTQSAQPDRGERPQADPRRPSSRTRTRRPRHHGTGAAAGVQPRRPDGRRPENPHRQRPRRTHR